MARVDTFAALSAIISSPQSGERRKRRHRRGMEDARRVRGCDYREHDGGSRHGRRWRVPQRPPHSPDQIGKAIAEVLDLDIEGAMKRIKRAPRIGIDRLE